MTASNLSHAEQATVTETLECYDLTPAQVKTVWAAIELRWKNTSGRFYAYTVAHEIAAAEANHK